jgi:nitrite reductase/ring-hydroxylating ferredoxin subunit
MSFSGGWYPVALSNQLEPATSAGTRLFDREICIWRDSDGGVHAWEDRCPHRGMRLSFGFVRGDRIACLYHGWQYDMQGRCRFIPAHPQLDVPSTIRVATYPCIDRLGMVWMCSDLKMEMPLDLPIDRRDIAPVRSLYVDCAPIATMQALSARSECTVLAGGALISIHAGPQNMIAGFQPFGKGKTALHIVFLGSPEQYPGNARRSAAVWAEELRHDLEREPVPDTAPAGSYEAAPWRS